jgi:hypothetical protein
MLGFKGQYVCPIRLLSHPVVHCDPITLGGGGTCAAPEQASRNAIPDGNVVKFQKSGKPDALALAVRRIAAVGRILYRHRPRCPVLRAPRLDRASHVLLPAQRYARIAAVSTCNAAWVEGASKNTVH